MATSKMFLQYVQDQTAHLPVRFRPMMGEYVVYYGDRVVGGLYDNCFMIKDVPAARAMMPDAEALAPYAGAREMLRLDCLEKPSFLEALFAAMYDQLRPPARRRRKTL